MPQGDAGHPERAGAPPPRRSGRVLRATTTGLVVLVLVAAGLSYRFDLGTRWLGWDHPSPTAAPAEVAPPPGLALPAPRPAAVVGAENLPRAVDPAKVRRALAALVAGGSLGRRAAVDVHELPSGTPVYRHGPHLVIPASTLKMLTATAALEALGPGHRFRTTVVAGATPRQIVLVGGGDPLLARAPAGGSVYPARADLDTLAAGAAKALRGLGRTTVRLRYDTSLFTGPAVSPHWPASYIADNVVSPISPLWVDEGRERPGLARRSGDPSGAAADVFAAALARHDITVLGRPRPGLAPADATELAVVESAPLAQVVQHVVEVSDNEGAEVLARQVAVAEGRPASFAGGAAAVRAVLDRLHIDTTGDTVLDGSGLSRANRLDPATLLAVIDTAAGDDHPRLRAAVADLPVAGFTGSLAYRFETGDPDGLGLVRAKTGTLTGVHGLAGTVTSVDGAVMSFVAIADRVKLQNTLAARARLDQIAAALAGCSCSSSQPSASPTP